VALANDPPVLLADEPTGELDSESAAELFATLRALNHDLGVTIVVLTHDELVSEQVLRTVEIRDGRTSSETLRRLEQGVGGEERVVAEELAVLDRSGRLQLPRDYVDALALERRVRLALERDHISIWPHRRQEDERDGG
jgi:putative ABC transport system ATP-binding protein